MKSENLTGIIREPGKFEGQHRDIRYWYNAIMDGYGNAVSYDTEPFETCATWFEITDEDREHLAHSDKSMRYAVIIHSEFGFEYLEYRNTIPLELEMK